MLNLPKKKLKKKFKLLKPIKRLKKVTMKEKTKNTDKHRLNKSKS